MPASIAGDVYVAGDRLDSGPAKMRTQRERQSAAATMYPGIFQRPRTLAHCADHGLELRTFCAKCSTHRHIEARRVCRAFRDWTIDEIQRAGALGCGECRGPVSVAVMGTYWMHPSSFETWPVDAAGWVRKRTDGMNG